MAAVKSMNSYNEHYSVNYIRYEKILDSFETCTKKLDTLIEKTAAIEKETNTRKRKR